MEITFNRKSSIVMSPFGRKTRVFTDVNSSGEDLVIGPNRSLPDLARTYYASTDIAPIKKFYAFLDRDNKERAYDPIKEDPFVFNGLSSVKEFKNQALQLIDFLNKEWTDLGLPLKKDEDRNIMIPDGSIIWENLATGSKIDAIVAHYKQEVAFILSNVDIMKKACIVRGVIPGWWASSYSGKDSPNPNHFQPSVRAHVKAVSIIESSSTYKSVRKETDRLMGDPIDSNVGYPFYTGNMDKEGRPTTRIQTVQTFEGIGTQNFNVSKLFKEVDRRGGPLSTPGYPFAVAPIRRNSYGYKWSHVFKRTGIGLQTDYDEKGNNTTRIAWIVPYIFNLFMSPLQAELKSLRKMMPGLYHDGSAKKRRMDLLRRDDPWVVEADYANYDRFLPVNLFLSFIQGYLKNKPNPNYWFGLCYAMHHAMPLIWPDYEPSSKGRGWVFTPKKLGLLSGVKITSEEGSFVNSIVTGQSLIDAGTLNEAQLVDYLVQYKDGNVGGNPEYIYIQSDDTCIISKSLKEVKAITNSFVKNVAQAGLKGEAMYGDRFLMRSISGGKDLPVPSRVFQNTLQNETPPEDALKFLVGLAMRTDGLLGQKTYDPFGSGRTQKVSKVEVRYTLKIITSLLSFVRSAHSKQNDAVTFLTVLEEAATVMSAASGDHVAMNASYATKLDNIRKAFLKALADRDLGLLKSGLITSNGQAASAMLYQLHKDANIPSQKLLLDQLLASDPSLQHVLNNITDKEHNFYNFAMKTMGIPRFMV